MKLVELVYHLRPRRLWRLLAAPDRRVRRQLRHCVWHITAVFWYEVYEGVAGRLGAALRWGKSRRAGRAGSRTTGHHPAPVVADHSLVDAGDARLG